MNEKQKIVFNRWERKKKREECAAQLLIKGQNQNEPRTDERTYIP
jgi:hypothetical protein